MRFIVLFAAALALAPGASADTLTEVTSRGVIASVSGFMVEMTLSADGKFTAMDGQFTGAWRINGEKLCLTGDADKVETCTVYPAEKKSGDTFDITSPDGPISIQIK